ncbi:MAG: hypothetical protein QOD99_1774 [Chthoniobacter sp.]|nr:hypothetical protein [Chthoniobacter sp.]
MIFACFVGSAVGDAVLGSQKLGAGVGLAFGLLIVLLDRLLKGITLRTFSSATFGLLLGLLFSRLLLASEVLKNASDETQWVVGLAAYCTFGYLGMMLAVRSSRDEFSLIIPYIRFQQESVQDAPMLVDTNIVLDMRLAKLCATGFLSKSLIVPRFVLDELQRLADSAEAMKRERGRRGLDALNEMQRGPEPCITIHETTTDPDTPVDVKLIQLARYLQARLLTNDSNLCKVARLQNVIALNLNELANALRSELRTGEEMELLLTKEGRESHQAVGYLDDGTMIVVNQARAQLGKVVAVAISGSLQTAAGRLFFAELKK